MTRAVEQKSRQKLKPPQCFNCGEAVGLVTKSHFPLHFGPVEARRSGNRRTDGHARRVFGIIRATEMVLSSAGP